MSFDNKLLMCTAVTNILLLVDKIKEIGLVTITSTDCMGASGVVHPSGKLCIG